jgi:hypothetical protein
MCLAPFIVRSIVLTVIASACGALTHDEISSSARSKDEPPVYGLVRGGIGQQWVYVDSHIQLGDQVHVKLEKRDADALRLVVDNMGRGIGEQVTIQLTRTDKHRIDANCSVAWHRDYGPPFDGNWSDVRGEVWVNSVDLSSPKLVVHFELRGMVDGTQQAIHGEVPLPN